MEITLANIVLVAGGTLTALQAGLMYDFSVDVVPSLRSISAKSHIEMMKAINVKIENPVFFISFFGPVLLLPLAAFLHRGEPQFAWLAAVSAIHILGDVGTTVVGNIPLNNKLALVDEAALTDAEAERIRQEFQGPGSLWSRFHMIRTLTTTLATALIFIIALSK
jgi:uncharacterized membrane protein